MEGRLIRFLLPIWLALLLSPAFAKASASAEASAGKPALASVVAVADHLALSDVPAGVAAQGAVGLMNTGRLSPVERYVALGAGVRLAGSQDAAWYDAGELVVGRRAGRVYRIQTGERADKSSAVCLGFARVQRENEKPFAKGAIGLVGDTFHRAGLSTAVLGNADTEDERSRLAPFIAADSHGTVDVGALSTSEWDPASPGGVRDHPDLAAKALELAREHDLVVVELGDLSRLEAVREYLTDEAYARHRAVAVRRLWSFIERVRPGAETLILVSPSRVDDRPSNLSPIVLFGGGRGVLTSATTHTRGLVSDIDLGPTILAASGLAAEATGQPIKAVPGGISELAEMERVAVRNYTLRIPVLVGVAAFVVLTVTLTEAFFRARRKNRAAKKALSLALLGLLSLPLALLIADNSGAAGAVTYLAALVGSAVGICALSSLFRRSPVAAVLCATAIVVAVDVATGAHLIRRSIITCDPITGIRYYGVGNEYMGVLAASSLVGPILITRRASLLLPWFAAMSIVIGYPALGANVGGLITAIAAFGVALIALSGRGLRLRHALVLAGTVVAMVLVFAVSDTLLGDRESHLGRSFLMMKIHGWQYAWMLAGRKVSMHLGILSMPQTYWPMIGSIPFFAMYAARVKKAERGGILYRVGAPATFAGMAAAFLANDSGIVPAALLVAIFLVTALYEQLREVKACG
ncbi:MAG: hypothetical protein ACYC2Y_03090 [Armatimonadota bacterium]